MLIFMAYANGESGKKESGENEREQGMKGYEVLERDRKKKSPSRGTGKRKESRLKGREDGKTREERERKGRRKQERRGAEGVAQGRERTDTGRNLAEENRRRKKGCRACTEGRESRIKR